MKVTVVVPLNGEGARFGVAGYHEPKPFVRCRGKALLFWLLDALNLELVSRVVVAFAASLCDYNLESVVQARYPGVSFLFVPLHFSTIGALETLKIALDALERADGGSLEDGPVLSLDADTYYTCDIVKLFRDDASAACGTIFAFEDRGSEPLYSYVSVDDDGERRRVLDIAEKVKLSSLACTGAYGFGSAATLRRVAEEVLRDPQAAQQGEHYVSCAVKALVARSPGAFACRVLEPSDVHCLGTPWQVQRHLESGPPSEGMRLCFDLDNTLLTPPSVPGDYSTTRPIGRTVEFLRAAKRQGHTIIIHTARRMRTHGGNVGAAAADIAGVTVRTLESLGIPYDELHFGKPHADVYIDDLAVPAQYDLVKATGLPCEGDVLVRRFHTIDFQGDVATKRSSLASGLRHEILYYRSLPAELRRHFPALLGADEDHSEYTMERLRGSTFTRLLTLGTLTLRVFREFLATLGALHAHLGGGASGLERRRVYANYLGKLQRRMEAHPDVYGPHRSAVEGLLDRAVARALRDYEDRDLAVVGVIHGDPVFSNVVLTWEGCVKFFDVRGEVDGVSTILGDVFYDYAKVYQSLMGYDEVLMGTRIRPEYRSAFVRALEEHVTRAYGEERWRYVRQLTIVLLLSILPLHSEEPNRLKFLQLASHIELRISNGLSG